MQRDPAVALYDILQAARDARQFMGAASVDEYAANDLLKAAVERKLEIAGEATRRLETDFPEVAAAITDHRKIVDFRNRLTHGYDRIQDSTVWDIVHWNVPVLISEVEGLLERFR